MHFLNENHSKPPISESQLNLEFFSSKVFTRSFLIFGFEKGTSKT